MVPVKARCQRAHRRVTPVDRTTVYCLERDGIQDSVAYSDQNRKTSQIIYTVITWQNNGERVNETKGEPEQKEQRVNT